MPLTYIGDLLTQSGGGSLTITPAAPPGTLAGDLAIVQLTGDSGAPTGIPAGWTEILFNGAAECGVIHRLYWKELVFPGETGTWTFAFAFVLKAAYVALRGQGTPIPNTNQDICNGGINVWTWPAVTVPANVGILLFTAGPFGDTLGVFAPAPTVSRYLDNAFAITYGLVTVGTLVTFGLTGPGVIGPWTAPWLSGFARTGTARTVAIASVTPAPGKHKKMGGSGIGLPFVRPGA